MSKILQKRIEEAARDFNRKEGIPYALTGHVFNAFIEGATFALKNQWISVEEALPKEEDLPEFDREVIALQRIIGHHYRVVFAHRPADTINIETYGKGGWNIPEIKWWLDLELPIEY